jgi:hypothetical protein
MIESQEQNHMLTAAELRKIKSQENPFESIFPSGLMHNPDINPQIDYHSIRLLDDNDLRPLISSIQKFSKKFNTSNQPVSVEYFLPSTKHLHRYCFQFPNSEISNPESMKLSYFDDETYGALSQIFHSPVKTHQEIVDLKNSDLDVIIKKSKLDHIMELFEKSLRENMRLFEEPTLQNDFEHDLNPAFVLHIARRIHRYYTIVVSIYEEACKISPIQYKLETLFDLQDITEFFANNTDIVSVESITHVLYTNRSFLKTCIQDYFKNLIILDGELNINSQGVLFNGIGNEKVILKGLPRIFENLLSVLEDKNHQREDATPARIRVGGKLQDLGIDYTKKPDIIIPKDIEPNMPFPYKLTR